jgi:hypothetical protein
MSKTQKFMARQGDVLLKQINRIPDAAKVISNKVIAVGEGHHEHKVIGEVEVYQNSKTSYLSVGNNGRLVHVHTGTEQRADHFPIDLPTGFYEVIHQRQYNPYDESTSRVLD